MTSLRSRLLLGAVLWTAGLLAVANVLATFLVHRFPGMIRITHGALMSATALVLLLCGLSQVRRGMSPLAQLRARLAAVREGRERRLEGSYPLEVQPLVNDLNALLEYREQIVKRALTKAGDLAHGLKTPLAVLSHEAERAAADGHAELAATIGHEVERMRRQLDYHLAQARSAAFGTTPGAACSVADSVEGLARALLRLHAARGLALDVRVPADHRVKGQIEDLDEMLGNLLDNACKWAASRVSVESSADADAIVISVEDDGPGLPPSMWEAVLQRGVRVDEAAPGSGLGLAIARDLAELHGGSIVLGRAGNGGLRARLRLPSA
jgi:signal transduction histidine kinase